MKPQKIVFINQTLGMGGAEQFGEDLLAEFQDLSIEVKAYVTNSEFQQQLQKRKINTLHIPVILDIIGDWKGLLKAICYFPKAFFIYRKIVQESKDASAILVSGFPEKILVSWLAYRQHTPVVWIEYGPLSTVFHMFFRLPYFLYRSALPFPALVIVPSMNTKQDLVKNFPELSKITVIPCGRPVPKKYDVQKKNYQIACVSRMEKGKGQDILVEAFAKVVADFPEARLVFVGKGDFDQYVQKTVKKYRLEKSVLFLGKVPDPLAIMAESHVCVFPSQWQLEGFGMVTIEAMSLGKPVVAFNTGPTPEIIQDGINGLLAEPGNENALADKIIEILRDSTFAGKLGQQAHKDFMTKYQISHVAQQYIQAISQVLE